MNYLYATFGPNFMSIVNFLRELPKASSYAIRK